MFYRWRRMDEYDRGRVWRFYGWFTALMACGSCIGAVAWGARMTDLVLSYESRAINSKPYEFMLQMALVYRWRSFFLVTYAVEFLCLSAAKLMVLDRMSLFAAPQGAQPQQRWALAGHFVMAAVVLGNAVGLAANAAAAVNYKKAAEAASTASAYFAANRTSGSDGDNYNKFYLLSRHEQQLSDSTSSVQSWFEVAVLLLIVVSFVAVGVLSVRRVMSRLLGVDAASAAAATGRVLRLQIVATTAFVFVTFVVRSAFSTMYAAAQSLQDYEKPCLWDNRCYSTCYNMYTHIAGWMFYTPEFQTMFVLVSSPLALLVALWGMTSKSTLQLMKSSQTKETTSLVALR
jgi:hypothetical protein